MTKRKIRQDYAAKTLNLYKNCFIKRQRRGAQYLLSEYKDVNERILDAVFLTVMELGEYFYMINGAQLAKLCNVNRNAISRRCGINTIIDSWFKRDLGRLCKFGSDEIETFVDALLSLYDCILEDGRTIAIAIKLKRWAFIEKIAEKLIATGFVDEKKRGDFYLALRNLFIFIQEDPERIKVETKITLIAAHYQKHQGAGNEQ